MNNSKTKSCEPFVVKSDKNERKTTGEKRAHNKTRRREKKKEEKKCQKHTTYTKSGQKTTYTTHKTQPNFVSFRVLEEIF